MPRFFLLFLLIAASCASFDEGGSRGVFFREMSFGDLDGWSDDNATDALRAFRRSCPALRSSTSWADVCARAFSVRDNDSDARLFFEGAFRPYRVEGDRGDTGLFTGYYMPELRGSPRREGPYQIPLYARPKDLVSVDLGAFQSDLKGKKIVGKIHKDKLVPYDARSDIAQGSLDSRAKPLVWVDSSIDAFFLGVQGSGLVRFKDGRVMAVGYDGTNGRAYVSLGRVLADRCEIPRPVTMSSLRTRLKAYPLTAQDTMNLNPSYVFFRPLPTPDAIGAQGVPLTSGRSLAVDPRYVPLGVPAWLDTRDGQGGVFQRLMIAQDTGGAIKGAVRGDVFWGIGPEAAVQAGAMQSRGRLTLLWPKISDPNDGKR